MEDALSLISRGCKLARELEANLSDLASQPHVMSNCCELIADMFGNAKDSLSSFEGNAGKDGLQGFAHRDLGQPPPSHSLMNDEVETMQQQEEWGRLSQQQAHQAAIMLLQGSTELQLQPQQQSQPQQVLSMAQPMQLVSSGGSQWEALAGTGRASSSSSQRPRRRKQEVEKRIVRVPAPVVGNTEIPPEDGYTWRKYGQKEIYGCMYPRGYYRCTHQKLYQCPAKKQVQRLDDDPYTYQVTYRGDHTCHMTATAPSAPPPMTTFRALPVDVSQLDAMPPSNVTSTGSTTTTSPVAISRWLSIDYSVMMGGGESSSNAGAIAADNAGSGPSTVQYSEREAEDHAVVDLVDAMFNPGGAAGNSMDFMFPSARQDGQT